MKDVARLLKDKSVVLVGGPRELREELVAKCKAGWKGAPKTGVYSVKAGLKTADKFLYAVARDVPITSPLGLAGEDMSLDQINDYWLEWPHEREFTSALVIIPEIGGLAKADPRFVGEKIGHMLGYQNMYQLAGRCELRFLLTSETQLPLDAARGRTDVQVLPSYFKAGPGRRSKDFDTLVEQVTLG